MYHCTNVIELHFLIFFIKNLFLLNTAIESMFYFFSFFKCTLRNQNSKIMVIYNLLYFKTNTTHFNSNSNTRRVYTLHTCITQYHCFRFTRTKEPQGFYKSFGSLGLVLKCMHCCESNKASV